MLTHGKMKIRKAILSVGLMAVMFINIFAPYSKSHAEGLMGISVTNVDFAKQSSKGIAIGWTDEYDPYVLSYTVLRRDTYNSVGTGEYKVIATVNSDGIAGNGAWSVLDKLSSSKPQQYEYRIDVVVRDPNTCYAAPGKAFLASNILICVDPGHFIDKNKVPDPNSYGYCEGNFTLKIGLKLYTELKTKYGIGVYMTRMDGNIIIDGMANQDIDGNKIKLRGELAGRVGADLFVSLHTNSNADNANGYPTYMQPTSLNRPLVIVNVPACSNQVALNVANSIGLNLVRTNYKMGISTVTNYAAAAVGKVPGWTTSFNDGVNLYGATLCRTNSRGADYYGVLKGAANVRVPGMIVEHGFHSCEAMRKAAVNTDLDSRWAVADAYGIAYGFGFVVNPTF